MNSACVCGHTLLQHEEEICPRGTVTGRCTGANEHKPCDCPHYEHESEH